MPGAGRTPVVAHRQQPQHEGGDGGGVLRDVLANEVPSLLRWDRDLYAVPAIVGAAMVALCLRFDALNPVTSTTAAVTTFVLRLLAMRYHWRAPRAWHRRSTVTEGE